VNNTNVMSAQVSVWHKPLADGSTAAALLNMGLFDGATYNLTVTAELLGLDADATYNIRDLWAAKDIGAFSGSKSVWLDPTTVMMWKMTKTQPS
jgi:hypothetical protein